MDTVILDEGKLEALRTERGGFTRATATALGVSWPLRHGWLKLLIGKSITADGYQRALEGRKTLSPKIARIRRAIG